MSVRLVVAWGVLLCVWMKIAVKPPVTSRARREQAQELLVAGTEHGPRVAVEPAADAARLATLCAERAPAATGAGGPTAVRCRRAERVQPCPASQPEPCPQPMDDDRPPRLWLRMWKRFAVAALLIAAAQRHRDRHRGAQQGQPAGRRGVPHPQPHQGPEGPDHRRIRRRPADLPGARDRPPRPLQRRPGPRKPAPQRHDPARPLRPEPGADDADVDPPRPAGRRSGPGTARNTPTRRSTPPTRSAASSEARARAACWRPKRSNGKCSRR